MKNLLATTALATVVSTAPAFAGDNSNTFTGSVQDVTVNNVRKRVPDDYFTVLCVTCQHVHMVSPGNRELSGDSDD